MTMIIIKMISFANDFGMLLQTKRTLLEIKRDINEYMWQSLKIDNSKWFQGLGEEILAWHPDKELSE